MDKVKIILENGSETEVYSIFYLYNSKYYFIYTTGEVDENEYVILYLVQVGKELKNTPEGMIDTGCMVGIEISNPDEWKSVQESITEIVNDKKNNTKSDKIQYLPNTMLSTLKVVSKKTFRLMKRLIEEQFGLDFKASQNLMNLKNGQVLIQDIPSDTNSLDVNIPNQTNGTPTLLSPISNQNQLIDPIDNQKNKFNPLNTSYQESENNLFNASEDISQNNIIIDYRTRFFEEQEKNKQLQLQINDLQQKLESIKKVVE